MRSVNCHAELLKCATIVYFFIILFQAVSSVSVLFSMLCLQGNQCFDVTEVFPVINNVKYPSHLKKNVFKNIILTKWYRDMERTTALELCSTQCDLINKDPDQLDFLHFI